MLPPDLSRVHARGEGREVGDKSGTRGGLLRRTGGLRTIGGAASADSQARCTSCSSSVQRHHRIYLRGVLVSMPTSRLAGPSCEIRLRLANVRRGSSFAQARDASRA